MESPRRVDALHVSGPPDRPVLPRELAFVELEDVLDVYQPRIARYHDTHKKDKSAFVYMKAMLLVHSMFEGKTIPHCEAYQPGSF